MTKSTFFHKAENSFIITTKIFVSIDRCIVTLLSIIKFKKNFSVVTSENSNINEIDEQSGIADIVDEIDTIDIVGEIDIVNNAIDAAAFERLKTNITDIIKANDIVSQTTSATTTTTTNTKIIFLN